LTLSRPLRVAVALDRRVVPRWICKVVSDIASGDFAEIAFLIIEDRTERNRVAEHRTPALYRWYEQLDYRLFRSNPDALARADVSSDVAGIPALHGSPPASDFETVDLILWFASSRPPAHTDGVATYGRWFPVGVVDAFWPMYEQSAISTFFIVVDGSKALHDGVVYRSTSAVDPISLYRNRNNSCWKAAHMLVKHIRLLAAERQYEVEPTPVDGLERLYRIPSTRQLIRHGLRVVAKATRRQLESRVFWEPWFIAYRERPSDDVPPAVDAESFRLVVAPPGRFFADPFVVEREGRHYVFLEDYSDSVARAVISCFELGVDGNPGPVCVVLEREYHLSYPFVFEHDGEMWMIPETRDAGRIELYRADAFPRRWSFERELIADVAAVDATVFEDGERYWLFASVALDGVRIGEDLFLYWSSSPFGPWTPHPCNPVVSDARCARPAGRIFRSGGYFVRPAQDASLRYGAAVVFKRIDKLTEKEYRETEIGRIDPAWLEGNCGTHSYNFNGRYEVLDARRRRRRPRTKSH